MRLRPLLGLAAVLPVLLVLGGCGSGTDVGLPTIGVLKVGAGGSGLASFARGLTAGQFGNSVTVAVHQPTDLANQYTIFTFFGLSRIDYRSVPQSALVVFVNGIDPVYSLSTTLPSPNVAMALHYFTPSQQALGLPQLAAQVFDSTQSGAFIIESLGSSSGGGYISPTAPDRQVRYANVDLRDSTTSDSAGVQGQAPFILSTNIDQAFFGYCGNLGLLRKPANGSGGPPSPPGQTGTGIGGTGGTGTGGETPPSPPLR